ncbi:MAG: flagellar basal-body MS-ring/collar protein FliF [Pseudomonadota bacterium]
MAIVAVAILGLAAWLLLSPADRAQVQPGLPIAEKGRALEALSAAGFDAQLDPSTGALTVPAGDFYRARMVLAGEGMPLGGGAAGGDGMSAIEGMPMGTSRQVEAARLRRMQELDLARTITELRPVRAARVHLALPERTAFVRDTEPPRASVVLDLAPGLALDSAQVRAIVSMVAAAVPDMPRGNVSVVDQLGTLLTAEDSDPLQAEADRQLAHQRRMERLYRDRVTALLTPMVGAGNAAVEITLDMDFTRTEVTSEEFSPDTALRSEQTSQQSGSGALAVGIPGAVSNLPPQETQLNAADAAGDDAGGDGQNAAEGEGDGANAAATPPVPTQMSQSTTRNFEVSRRVETRQPQVAQVTKVFAAVLLHEVPAAAETAAEGSENARDTLLADVEALTRSAIGYDAARGDLVTVATAPFVEMAPITTAPAWHEAAWLPDLGRAIAQLLVLAIVILGVIRPLMARILPAPGAIAQGDTPFAGAVEVQRGESFSALRRRIETATPSIEDLDGALTYEEKVDVVRELAGADTNRIAGVFKEMLNTPDQSAR